MFAVLFRDTVTDPRPVVVSSLLGHGNVAVALRCYRSVARHSATPLEFRLHDDGSLTDEDRHRLAAAVPVAEFVARTEADRRMETELRHEPVLLELRRRNPLGLKLLDAVLWSEDEVFRFVDSDIYCLRPFQGLFDLPDAVDAVFIRDYQDAYSLRSWHLLSHPRLRVPRQVNTGIVVYRRRAFDRGLLVWYLSQGAHRFSPGWEEQTAWALLAGRVESRFLSSRQFWIPRGVADLEPSRLRDTLGLHLVTPVRHLLDRVETLTDDLHLAPGTPAPPATTVEYQRPSLCRPWHLARSEAGRGLRRLLARSLAPKS